MEPRHDRPLALPLGSFHRPPGEHRLEAGVGPVLELRRQDADVGARQLGVDPSALVDLSVAAGSPLKSLDDVIARLQLDFRVDELQLKRLKKRKLMLKDQIARIADEITPDIIA